MPFDTIVVNGRVILPLTGETRATIAIQGGKIAALLDPSLAAEAAETIDAAGNIVFPGAIDPHEHIGFVGRPLTEIATETRSAAIGGVTTVIMYHLKSEPYDASFADLQAHIQRLAHVDVAAHFGAYVDQHIQEMGHYIRDFGVSSFKFFMHFKGEEAAKRGLTNIDEGFMYEFMTALARFPGAVANVHAENIEVIWAFEKRAQAQGLQGLAAWNAARPGFAEADNVHTAYTLSQLTGCPVYIVHMSSAESVQVARRFKQSGARVYVETCPQYLTLTVDSPCGVLAKVVPPVRTAEDNAALWAAVADGTVDTIATDHSGRGSQHKQGDIWEAGNAFPGVGTMLPLMISEGYHKGRVSLKRIAEVTSYNAARIFNLYPRKGTIQPGSDADLTIVDLDQERVVDPAYLQSEADYSPWEGWTVRGWPVRTMVRGQTVMLDGEIVGAPGYGAYVRRDLP